MKNKLLRHIWSLLIIFIFICILFPTTLTIYGREMVNTEENLLAPSSNIEGPVLSKTLNQDTFTLVLLPDTQIYSKNYPEIYTNQTEWIVNNSEEKNIVYVLHEGDITNNNNQAQWANANASQRVLDGIVHYTLSPGNHDLGPNGNSANRDTYMNDYFNLTQFEAWPTFGGAFEPYNIENTYHLFTAGATDWMIVSLEFAPRDAVLAWANQVVVDHPDRIILVVTHNYLAGNIRNTGYGGNYGLTSDPAGAATGEDIWQNFVKKHRNILCVFCGHILTEAGYLASTGDHGNLVHQMLANFQMLSNGGNGYMRLVEFDTTQEKIFIKTYSPYLDQFKTSSQHQFTINYKKWDYVNDPPVIKNNITQIDLNEDSEAKYLDLDGYSKPETGIFEDPNIAAGDDLTFYIWDRFDWEGLDDDGSFVNENLTVTLLWNDSIKIEPKVNKFGSDIIKMKAMDKRGDFITTKIMVTIHPMNDPPIINNTLKWKYQSPELNISNDQIKCFEDQWVNFTVTAYDPLEPEDDIKLKFSVNSSEHNAPFFTIDEDTGYVSFLPVNEDIGIYYLKITVNDGGEVNNINEYYFTVEVNNTNDPPSITTTDITECFEDNLYYVEYRADDIDPTNDPFIWDLTTNTSFLKINRYSGVLSGIPNNDDVGYHFVNITVSDRIGGLDFSNFTLIVQNVNDPPIINNSVIDFYFYEDTLDTHINLNYWFKDIDNDVLTYDFEVTENVSISIFHNGIVNIVPKANWSGKGTLTFYANDSIAEISDSVNFIVKPVNDPPTDVIIILAEMEYHEGQAQPAFGNATDVDIPFGDKLYFVWYSNITGEIDWGQEINLSLPAGVHNITLSVRDKEREWCNISTEIEIFAIHVNIDDDGKDKKDDKSTQGLELFFVLIGIVVVIISLIIIIFLIMNRKKKDQSIFQPKKEQESLKANIELNEKTTTYSHLEEQITQPTIPSQLPPTHPQTPIPRNIKSAPKPSIRPPYQISPTPIQHETSSKSNSQAPESNE